MCLYTTTLAKKCINTGVVICSSSTSYLFAAISPTATLSLTLLTMLDLLLRDVGVIEVGSFRRLGKRLRQIGYCRRGGCKYVIGLNIN